MVREKGCDEGTGFVVNQVVESIELGMVSAKKTAAKIVEAYKTGKNTRINRTLLTREFVLENVTYELINRQRNVKKLESVPHKDFLDLAITYKVTYRAEDGKNMVLELNNKTIESVKVSLDELDAAARKNTEAHGFVMMNVPEVLGIRDGDVVMHVITNAEHYRGAVALLYKDRLQAVADMYRANVIIIPSSIHEILVMPEMQIEERSLLREIISDENKKEEVGEANVLGDYAYRYDRKTGELSIIK